MALTITATAHNLTYEGGRRDSSGYWAFLAVTFDASYATGGEDFTAAAVNTAIGSNLTVSAINAAIPMAMGHSTAQKFFVHWDSANNKLQAYDAYGTETTATTDLNTGARAIPVLVQVTAA